MIAYIDLLYKEMSEVVQFEPDYPNRFSWYSS